MTIDDARTILSQNGIDTTAAKIQQRNSSSGDIITVQIGDQTGDVRTKLQDALAKKAGVKALSLFHHDPAHDDDTVDRLLEGARVRSARVGGPPVFAAAEGLTIEL